EGRGLGACPDGGVWKHRGARASRKGGLISCLSPTPFVRRALSRGRFFVSLLVVRDLDDFQRSDAPVRERPSDRLARAEPDQCGTERRQNRNAVLIDVRGVGGHEREREGTAGDVIVL